jgi:hypothetical protein
MISEVLLKQMIEWAPRLREAGILSATFGECAFTFAAHQPEPPERPDEDEPEDEPADILKDPRTYGSPTGRTVGAVRVERERL